MSGVIVLVLRLALAGCLYAFLGWVLFILWKELQTQGVELAARKAPLLSLTIQRSGTDTINRVVQQLDIIIGRDPACDISLDDDAVSAHHIRLFFHHKQWWVEDLGSTNGTRLNQVLLATPTVITNGDQIECGHTALTISIEAAVDLLPTLPL
jgi:pSer/pThr/pTyr-binding forkhead associated (FHA) protein